MTDPLPPSPAAARGGSEYVAAAANFTMREALGGLALPRPLIDSDYLAPQPDLLAAALALLATMTAVLGTKVRGGAPAGWGHAGR